MTLSPTDLLRACDTSVVADALDAHGIDGVATGIPPAHPEWSAVGPAHTLRLVEADDPGEGTNFPFAMLGELAADTVLVIEGADPTVSCWGGNASRLAAAAGVAGVVVDGGFRDVPEVREGSFPVFGRQPTPRTGQRRLAVEGIGDAVEIDGIAVEPGDVVVADATGVVVVPAEEAAAVASTAEEILAEERLLEAKIDAGASVADLRAEDHDF